MENIAYKRVLLKLSGESLAGSKGTGIDFQKVLDTCEEIKEIVRQRLIECRKEKHLTQTDVGLIVNKKKTTVATWEQGKTMPDIETLYNLAKYYGKTINYMFGESDE